MDETARDAVEINLLASPPKPVLSSVPTEDSIGLWHDRKLLVMQLNGYIFPARCIKSNEYFKGAPTCLDVVWIPNHWIWLLTLGLVGHVIAKSAYGRTISVEVPVSEEWQTDHKRKSEVGWAMIVGGICCFILGTVLYVPTMAGGAGDDSSKWILYAILATPLISIAGVIYLISNHKPIVTVRKATDRYVWLDGIDPNFLSSLPYWPPASKNRVRNMND